MRFFIFLLTLTSWIHCYSSHIVGGEIYYDYMGNNQYRISVVLYRDCFSTGAAYDNPLSLGIYSASNVLVDNVLIPFPGSINVPIVFSNPCVVPPNDVCIEKSTYSTIVNLPPTIGGYTLAYQRCCRGPKVTNLISPDGTGLTITAHIPGIETGFQFNSNARFTGYPPTILCKNEDLIFNHSASDPDGDILVYSLVSPNQGANSTSPAPNPPPAPPYLPVNWLTGFSATNPIGNGAAATINSSTGILTANPKMLGLFVVGIRVQEYRNNKLVSETIRDFLFKVIDCEITLKASIPKQIDMDYFVSYCQGLTVTFDNDSYGATNYEWDFGVVNSVSDVSSQFEPTFTYPEQGSYTVRLIANPGWPCTDTSFQNIIVNYPLEVSYSSNDSLCIQGNSFNFIGKPVGTNLNMASFEWNFGTNASIPNSTDLIVSNVSFTKSGYIPVTLTGKTGTCIAKYVDSIYIFPIPTVNFAPPNNYLCEGLTVKFKNSSTGIIKNEWDFGDLNATNDISNEFEPVFSYPNPGVYQVRLIGGSKGLCYDTSILTLTVNEVLDVWFSNNDSLCITSNSFNFDGSMVGSSTTTFLWDFGPYASITSSNTLDVNNVVFSVPGNITVSLTGNYENCKDSQTSTLFIYKEPTIDFEITPGLQCAPYVAKFINLSIADSQLSYNWEFGNGISSSNKSPTITYDSVGVYDVSLAISASKGCVDTLYLKKENFISVHPSPESKFIVNPTITDICHSTIHFFDQSVGATNYFYLFDNQSFSDQANPIFNYTKDGIFYPKQIVTNEFLCTDTSQQEIYIEPFMVYIPNAFTPDGDEFNNEFKTYTYFNSIEWDFQIYDRWGNLLFVSTDPRIGWDGYYKGKMVQDGVYTYKLRYISCESTKAVHELTGHFSLIK